MPPPLPKTAPRACSFLPTQGGVVREGARGAVVAGVMRLPWLCPGALQARQKKGIPRLSLGAQRARPYCRHWAIHPYTSQSLFPGEPPTAGRSTAFAGRASLSVSLLGSVCPPVLRRATVHTFFPTSQVFLAYQGHAGRRMYVPKVDRGWG